MLPFHHVRHILVLLGLSVLVISGCASEPETRSHRHPGTTNLVVERLDFIGVDSVSERQLRGGLATVEDAGWRTRIPFFGPDRRYFNRFDWVHDRERILAFYRQQGYYSASINSESIIEDPEAQTVRIRVSIDEGPPTQVSRISIDGLIDGLTPSASELLSEAPLGEGSTFVQANYRRMRHLLQDRLREAGHAYATISGRVFVNPREATADIYFYADPGPRAQFGDVYVVGLEDIDERAIRRAVRFRRGDDYDARILRRAQEDIYDLGVFGMVTVLPAHEARDAIPEGDQEREVIDEIVDDHDLPDTAEDPDDPMLLPEEEQPIIVDERESDISSVLSEVQTHAESRSRLDPEVPIIIRVQEATGYNLRLGTGVAVESTRQDVRGLVNWSARNFMGGLRRIEHQNAVGYAWAPGLLGPGEASNRGVILSSQLRFEQPQFIEPRTSLRIRAGVDRDVTEGFSLWNPSARISLNRIFGRNFILSASYNVAYFSYFNIQEGLVDETATELGLDFRESFRLEYLEQSATYDRRNDLLNPSRGFMSDITVQQAGRYIAGGDFDYIKPILSGEYYLGMTGNSLLALRSRLGAIYDVRRDTGVPIQSQLYSGGTDGMRSFGRRRLSLFTASEEAIPVGGSTQFEVSVEPRFRLVDNLLDIGDLWGAVFVDAATILGGPFLIDDGTARSDSIFDTADLSDIQQTLLYGAGAGMWWNTPVGPVRLDFAYTLSDITDDPRFRRCEVAADYGRPQCQFVPLNDDPIQDAILGYGIYISIGHSF